MATKDTAPKGPIRVRAVRAGFYGDTRIRPGQVFTLKRPQDFSKTWMVQVGADRPDDIAALKQAAQGQRAHRQPRSFVEAMTRTTPTSETPDANEPTGAARVIG